MKQLFIFDYDGVIADSLDIWIGVLEKAGEKHSHYYRMTKDNVNQLEHITMDSILAMSGKKREDSAEYLLEVFDKMKNQSLSVPFFEGIDSVIKKSFLNGNLVCVNTANGQAVVEKRLKAEKLDSYITEILGGDSPGSKSEKIRYLMDKYNFYPEATWMIGDSKGDIIEGKKAGVGTVAVTYGWHNYENMKQTEPEYIFTSISELEKFIIEKGS